jgi:hypothetical protein
MYLMITDKYIKKGPCKDHGVREEKISIISTDLTEIYLLAGYQS